MVRHVVVLLLPAVLLDLGCSRRERQSDVPADRPSSRRETTALSPERSVRVPATHAPAPGAPPGRAELPRDERSMAVLRAALEDKDYATRLLAIEGVGELRAEAFLPWLEHALGDPEHDVRLAAVDALSSIPAARASSLLVSVRDDPHEDLDVRALAASKLLKLSQR